ncbi:MAG: cation-translocating P-type ATPase [Candidatus Micrarchaeia archaeon]
MGEARALAAAWSARIPEVLRALGSSEAGLPPEEAAGRLEKFGFNELREEKRRSVLAIFLSQFASFMILLLIAATLIAAAFGEWIDAAAIAAILVLNAVLGTVQEHRAEKALEALKRMAAPTALVVRGGVEEVIPAREVVPGDIVVMEAGALVPADCRLLETAMMKVNEASLTGESLPVHKDAGALLAADTLLTGRRNMAFAGTVVANGRGTGVVVATGMRTEFGKIAAAVQTVTEEETPLRRTLERLGRQLTLTVVAAAAVIFALGSARGTPALEMFLTSVSLAVAAIPEGLPATITIALAVGVQRMARRNAIVRKLLAVETLGSASVICVDKTGTITKNEMTARQVWLPGRWIEVSGAGYETKGEFRAGGRRTLPEVEPGLPELLRVAALCNNASLVLDAKSGARRAIGDPTEAALLVLAEKAGLGREVLKQGARFVQEFPFDSDRKRMTVVYQIGGETLALTKGAPEVVLARCSRVLSGGRVRAMSPADRRAVIAANKAMASKALRVLAFAQRRIRDGRKHEMAEVERGLTFIGLVGLIDAPRDEVRPALALCAQAGIEVVMITGDSEVTARAVAAEVGMLRRGDVVVSGSELDAMSDAELSKRVERIRVYARISPEHKLRIVEAWKARGRVVAVTGDGVNDAPALKRADIGVAMGVTGTDVAKEVSDMVLSDDNFASIVNAVEEGRGIYNNIRKCIAYLLSGNVAEVAIVFGAVMLGLPLPLAAVQILWINLVTDGLPAIALSVDPISREVMAVPPREKERSIWHGMRPFIVDAAAILTVFAIALFASYNPAAGEAELAKAQTMIFTLIVVFEKFLAFSSRSLARPVGLAGLAANKWLIASTVLALAIHAVILYNPLLNDVFNVVPLSAWEWAIVLAVGAAGFAYLEALKWWASRREAHGSV